MSWNTSWGLYGNVDTSISNFLGTTDARPLLIKTSDKVALRVSAGGDVGVGLPGGTRSPDYKLDVGGVLNADDVYKNGTPLIGSHWQEVTGGIVYKGGNVGVGTTTPSHTLSVRADTPSSDPWRNQLALQGATPLSEARLGFSTTRSDGSGHHTAIIKTVVPSNEGGHLVFQTREAGFGAINERLRITNDGRVGIGTTTPGARLDISGSGGSSQCCAPVAPTLSLAEASSSANRQAWLQFHNGDEAEAYVRLAGGGPAGSGREGHRRIEIGDTQTASANLTVQGNVGVGKLDPQARLDVAGSVLLSGNHDVTTRRGVLRMGTTDGSQAAADEVVGAVGFWGYGRQHGQLSFRAGRGFELVDRSANSPSLNYAYDSHPYANLKLRDLLTTGNVGVGIPEPRAKLHVAGGLWNPTDTEGDLKVGDATYRLKIGVATGGGGAGDVRIRAHGGTNRLMLGSGTLDTLFVNGDRVGVGVMEPQARLHVAGGDIRLEGGRTFYAPGRMHVHGDEILYLLNLQGVVISRAWGGNGNLTVEGGAWKPGGGPFSISSDMRLKRGIEPLKGALQRLSRLRGVSFEWRKPEEQGNLTGTQMGLIAQEVEEVLPEWVETDRNGYKILTIRGFEALAVEAFKDLKAQNDELRGRIEALERA